jgi:hypothetical protein
MKPPPPLTIIIHIILKDSGTLTRSQVSVDCFASVLDSALASLNVNVAESAGTVAAAVEAVLDGVDVPSGTGGAEDVLVSMSMHDLWDQEL